MERIDVIDGARQSHTPTQLPLVQRLRADWIDPEAWQLIARRFNLGSPDVLRHGGECGGPGGRHLQVLQGIVGGLEDAEIAKVLGLKTSTVSGYIGELFERMDTDRRCRAVSDAWRASLGR